MRYALVLQVATPVMGAYSPMSPRLSSPAHPSSGGGGVISGAGRGRGRGGDRRDKELIGQTVRIVQGPYKGKSFGSLQLITKRFAFEFINCAFLKRSLKSDFTCGCTSVRVNQTGP